MNWPPPEFGISFHAVQLAEGVDPAPEANKVDLVPCRRVQGHIGRKKGISKERNSREKKFPSEFLRNPPISKKKRRIPLVS
jgi:hypothetical protein